MNVAGRAVLQTRDANLLHELAHREGPRPHPAGARREVARPHVAPHHVLANPPVEQRRVCLLTLGRGPVQLWCEVVHPSLAQPLPRIGVQLLVRIEAAHLCWIAGTPDAEWTDAEAYPRLGLVHAFVERLNQQIDIAATPVGTPECSALAPVAFPAAVIGKRNGAAATIVFRIRIEVVVDVHTIHVVALHHVEHHAHGARANRRFTGIHPQIAGVRFYERRMCARNVGARQRRLGVGVSRAIRIEPRMQLEIARMRFRDRERERIPERHRRAPLCPRKILRPRFDFRRVQRVGRRTNLKQHRVELERGRAVEECNELGLLFGRGQRALGGPVDIGDRRHPDATKFARQRRCHGAYHRAQASGQSRRGARCAHRCWTRWLSSGGRGLGGRPRHRVGRRGWRRRGPTREHRPHDHHRPRKHSIAVTHYASSLSIAARTAPARVAASAIRASD